MDDRRAAEKEKSINGINKTTKSHKTCFRSLFFLPFPLFVSRILYASHFWVSENGEKRTHTQSEELSSPGGEWMKREKQGAGENLNNCRRFYRLAGSCSVINHHRTGRQGHCGSIYAWEQNCYA